MTLANSLSLYSSLNLLLSVSFLALWICRKLNASLSGAGELKLHYSSLLLLFAVLLLSPFLPTKNAFQPPMKIWSAESFKTFPANFSYAQSSGFLKFSAAISPATIDAHKISLLWIFLGSMILCYGLWRLLGDLFSLRKIRKNAFLQKRIGRVSVYCSDRIAVPFSYAVLSQAHVILPSYLLAKKADYQMALAHELQHHRQRDTFWVYPLWALQVLCAPNPFVHAWKRMISEIQEFACDEVLVDQRNISSPAYARCLVEVAQTAIDQKRMPVCATGLTFLVDGNLLTRRIEKMLTIKKQSNRSIMLLGTMLTILLGFTAYASKGLVQDRRVTMEQAQEMAKAIDSNSFPITLNDRVLGQLNRFLGTPEGREQIKSALARMENYRETIESKLHTFHLPNELMAVPIVESAYQNLPDRNQHGYGAGLWMFIQSTARKYGMKVEGKIDERLNTEMETDAAVRYLSLNHARFQDWQLALLAYNAGENMVQRGIESTGSKDAWTLIKAGFEGDKDYLAKLTAAVLIMKNPDTLL